MIRRRLVLVLATTLVLGMSLVAMADVTPGGTFFDDDGNTHAGPIEAIAAEDITRGCNPPQNTNYCPDEPVTRGQMAAFLVRALGYTDDGGGDLFVDDDGSTFESDIDKLGTAGVTVGCNPPVNDRFCPDDPVTRDQMASFLSRALDLPVATPPARTDTTDGTRLNLLAIAGSQGCEVSTTSETFTVCTASTTVSAGDVFHIFHGWGPFDWSSLSAAEQQQVTSNRTRFELTLNGTELSMFDLLVDGEDGQTSKHSRFQFHGNLAPATHTLVAEWIWDNEVTMRITFDLTVTP